MSADEGDLAWLVAALGLVGDEAAAEAVWMATLWADHRVAIARFGYPKDNHLPPPLASRLASAAYARQVLEALEDDEDDEGDATRRGAQALRAYLLSCTESP